MLIKRNLLETNMGSFTGAHHSIETFSRLLAECKKVFIDLTESDINVLKDELKDTERPDRQKISSWLSNTTKTEYLKEENFPDDFQRTLSEIMNATAESQALDNKKIIFVMEDDSEIKVSVIPCHPNDDEKFYKEIQYFAFENIDAVLVSKENKLSRRIRNDLSTFLKNLTEFSYFENEASLKESVDNYYANLLNGPFNAIAFELFRCADIEIPTLTFSSEVNNWAIFIRECSNNPTTEEQKAKEINIFNQLWNFAQMNLTNSSAKNYCNIGNAKNMFKELGVEPFSWKFMQNDIEITATWNGTNLSIDKEVCERCGSVKDGSQMFVDPRGNRFCKSCFEDDSIQSVNRVLSYHSSTIFNPMEPCGVKPSEKSRYGMELELETNVNKEDYYDEDNDSDEFIEWKKTWWSTVAPIIYSNGNLAKLEYDGSLGRNGEEMISQPLNKEFILGEQMKQWLEAVKNLYHTESCCGLHFHVDKDALSAEQWGAVLRFVVKHYAKFVEVGIFRRTNGYNDLSSLEQLTSCYSDDKELFERFCSNSSHYSSISYSSHTGKTIEFRCFASTVEFEQFERNIKTIMMIMDNIDTLKNVENLEIASL